MKELSEQARAGIFFVIAIVIFLAWAHFFLPAAPTPNQLAQKAAKQSAVTQQVQAQAIAAAPATVLAVSGTAENSVVVSSSLYRVELSNRGGVVKSWQLEKYFDDQKPPHPLDLVNQDAGQELGWPLSLTLADPNLEAEANSALYRIVPSSPQVTAPSEVTMQWSDGHLSVTKKLGFANDYSPRLEVSVLLDGKPIPFGVAWRGEFGDKAVLQATQLVTIFYSQESSIKLLQYKSLGVAANRIQPFNQGGPMDFAGIEDQYFAAAFIPESGAASVWHWTQWHHYMQGDQQVMEPEAQVAVGPMSEGTFVAHLFVGPKDIQVLGQQKPSLEKLINFGWMGVISKPLLLSLQWMHRFIPNYGWVIILFTIALNMALFPIKAWTYQSTKKMQTVAPEIKMIQDRYKKYSMRDPRKQKMNEEVMAVYQREGINPLGSCLPMLMQIPILWALYRTLAYSIELRHAPWIGWIHDLAARDPYYILPVAMAVTMYISQKLTPMPATVDPAQQRMMMLMPLMFIVIFFRYAAGLNLYYLTVNLVVGAQQLYLNRTQPPPSRSKFKKNKQQ